MVALKCRTMPERGDVVLTRLAQLSSGFALAGGKSVHRAKGGKI
ncbi:hypothetical protein IQ25_01298 [Novosphingobium taihuense]|uniref:Uncharacterized protein n=1 Tax=Novosphingobium taihuense TaxID=260085 RepID=A0A7W7AC32_9SPHN|nr:hypothetical protein [Novosphingobium taihuense]TWH87021.1 hypothetical protein IQ25_01298 [Novosphingobium taihuense]